MKTRAAVAMEAGKPLEIMEVNLEGPKAGEVLVDPEHERDGHCVVPVHHQSAGARVPVSFLHHAGVHRRSQALR